MKVFVRSLVLLGIVAALSLLPGCFKLRQTLTLMPDGAGVMEVRVGLSEQLIASANEGGEDPFEDLRPENIGEGIEGVVAFGEPTIEEIDGFTYYTLKAYFDDVNDLSVQGMGEGDQDIDFTYERVGDTATLMITGSMIMNAADNYEQPAEDEVQMIRMMLAEFSFEERFVLPGEVTTMEGIETEGNTVNMRLDVNNAINGDGLIQTLEGVEELALTVSDIDTDAERIEAYNAEKAAAIEWWESQQE